MSKYEIPQWVKNLAWQVNTLIREQNAMPIFRKQLRVWRQEHRTRYKEWRAWQQKRREHVERALRPKTADDKALRNISGDPPHPGWKPSWQELPIPDHRTASGWAVIDTTRADWQELEKPDAQDGLHLWVPPELSWESEPQDFETLPLVAERALSEAERYLCLSALHDGICKGVERIDPWGVLETKPKHIGDAGVYAQYESKAATAPDDHRGPFESFLTQIESDLKANMPEHDRSQQEARAEPPETSDGSSATVDELVTLNQVAPLTGKSKRTLERYVQQGRLPGPDIRGGDGKANKWYWRTLRPALSEFASSKQLPERFPGSQII